MAQSGRQALRERTGNEESSVKGTASLEVRKIRWESRHSPSDNHRLFELSSELGSELVVDERGLGEGIRSRSGEEFGGFGVEGVKNSKKSKDLGLGRIRRNRVGKSGC